MPRERDDDPLRDRQRAAGEAGAGAAGDERDAAPRCRSARPPAPPPSSPGSATSAGTTRRPVRPSHSYVRSCSGSRDRRRRGGEPRRRSSGASPIATEPNIVGSARWRSARFLRSTRAARAGPARSARLAEAVPGRRACTASRSRRPRARGVSRRCSRRRERLDVRVHRVSQGSGVFMQTDARARRDGAARLATARVEVSLFARPNAAWGLSASARAHAGLRRRRARPGAGRREPRGLRARRRARLPLGADRRPRRARRSSGEARAAGLLPGDMQAKVSVMLPAANPAAARVLERLGASTINLPDRPDAAADRRDPRGGRRPARRVRRGARQRRRLRAPPRDPGADPRRRARLRQVRAAQRARRLSRRHAPRGDDRRAQPRARPPRAARPRAARALRLRAYRPRSSAPPGSPFPTLTTERRADGASRHPVHRPVGRSADRGARREVRRLGLRRARARLLGRPLRGRQGARRPRRMRAGGRELLERHGLGVWAIGAHLVGQAVCDRIDERHRAILPPEVYGDGEPEGVRSAPPSG